MDRLPSRYLASSLIVTLVASIVSFAIASIPASYASHTNVTVNVEGDAVTETYNPSDTVAISGVIGDVVTNEDVTLKFIDPTGITKKTVNDLAEDEDDGTFDYSYDIPSTAKDGVWTVEASYDGDEMSTFFIVDDDSDTITIELDNNDGIYAAGDQVTISGRVDNEDIGTEDHVEVTVLDPTDPGNPIVDTENADLGDGSLPDDEFEYSFDLDNDASHGRYAVIVTYDVDNQEGSILFEIPDEDSGGNNNDFTGDDDSDGDLSAQIEKDSYESGDNVVIEGSIDHYDSGDNEDLSVVVENPDGDEVDDYGDNSATVKSSGDFTYDFDLDNNADEGTYSVTMEYISDKITMTFDVDNGGSSGGSTGSSDLTVKLNKASYLAGDSIAVTGTVKHVADPKDDEVVSILLYKPDGIVVLSASKYVTPASGGAYAADILIPSNLDPDDGYKVVVSYLDDEVQTKFDITGVSSNPSDKITIQTDKTSYSTGNTVKMSGKVPSQMILEGQQLLLRVDTPNGDPCRIDPVEVPASGSFTYDLVLGGKCGVPGKYDVEATYGGQKGKTSFSLGSSSGGSSFGLTVAGKTYPIDYELSAGSLNSIFARPDDKKLIVNLNTDEDGKLTLVLPREVIDSVKDGKDTDFVITIEDESGNLNTVAGDEIQNTDQARTVAIDYRGGAERIEIIGTQVVPEFGAIAAVAMAVATIGVILATARFDKLSLFKQ